MNDGQGAVGHNQMDWYIAQWESQKKRKEKKDQKNLRYTGKNVPNLM